MKRIHRTGLVCAVLASVAGAFVVPAAHAQMQSMAPRAEEAPRAGERGAPGLAILTAKALICSLEGQQVQDNAVVLVKDGKIEAVLPRATTRIPADYEVLDVGQSWVMPGMIDLHCHVGGTFDINDAVYLANPGLRAKTAVIPGNRALRMGLAAGVTSVLFIPGSATNVGGEGVLIKTGPKRYEEALIRDPGSIKVAQWGNPERWAIGVGKTFENYTIREIFTRGRAYHARWKAFEEGRGPRPDVDAELEAFRHIFDHKIQASVHTQVYQVVLATITMLKGEFGIDVFIDHGEFHGFLTAELAQEMGVNAILGPRNVDMPSRGLISWVGSNPERMEGIAAAYQSRGHKRIGFNTDSPVIPQEELPVQATMAARHGFEDRGLETVRGLTIIPAVTVGLGNRLGSLEPGKDADILVVTGHPADPRNHIQLALIDGKRLYDAGENRRW
jgi:imidazolonepropionase-like amidohydrolase